MGQLFQASFDFILHSMAETSEDKVKDGVIAKERQKLKDLHEEKDSQAMWGQLKSDMLDMKNPPICKIF